MKSYGYAMLDRQVITSTAIRHKLFEKLRKLSEDMLSGESLLKVDKRLARIVGEYGAFKIFADELFARNAYMIWDALPFKGEADEVIAVTSGQIICANTRLERGKVIFFAEIGEQRNEHDESMLNMTLQQLCLMQSIHHFHPKTSSRFVVRYGDGWKQGVTLQTVRTPIVPGSGVATILEQPESKWVVVSDTIIESHIPVDNSHYMNMEFSKLLQAVNYIEGHENELVEKQKAK